MLVFMRIAIIAAAIFILLSCSRQKRHIDSKWLPQQAHTTIIVLQPLSSVPVRLLAMLKDSIPKYYPVTTAIATPIGLPVNAYYKPRNRYKADTLLSFLEKIKPINARIVAGITEKDISTKKGTVDDYGIMGYGFQPGYACVVSTYRLQNDHPAEGVLFQRLLKTVLHEIGHNFGLSHCPDKHCIMADAEGKLNQDNETGLCEVCRKKLNLK